MDTKTSGKLINKKSSSHGSQMLSNENQRQNVQNEPDASASTNNIAEDSEMSSFDKKKLSWTHMAWKAKAQLSSIVI